VKRFALVLVVLTAAWLGGAAGTADAWTTYMHNFVAGKAYDDVVGDGSVTINGRAYPVDPRIVTALRNHQSFFRAGVVGPDGLPDVTYGQRVVHIGQTGDWNRHVVVRAWAAQNDPDYSAVEREQILAFAYGYMAHAAGDMWAHTFVNGFAAGVFPGLSDILSDADNASIALRHLIGEVYIGDATPGYDGNKDRQPVPFEVNEDGNQDISDTSTPRQDFAAPSRFIYETFVNPENPLPFGTCNDNIDDDEDGTADDGCPGDHFTVGDPEPQRGPLIDFFLDLQAKLEIAESRFEFDSEHTDCSTLGGVDDTCESRSRNVRADTVRGKTSTLMEIWVCTNAPCVASGTDVASDLIDDLVEAYLEEWIEDIETGLEHWTEFGLATMRAMQDPQARRDAQNHICRNDGPEASAQRANCEDAVGMLDVMLFKADPFIEDHLLSMLGAPDVVGVLAGALDTISEFLADIIPYNPVTAIGAELSEIAKKLVKDAVEETLGLNLDHLKSLITSPTYWLNVENVAIELPVLGTVSVDLFPAGTHEFIDSGMGLPPNHHVFQELYIYGEPLPVAGTGLADNAVFNPETFKAFKNSVLQTKLLLLESGQLNALLKDELVGAGVVKPSATIATYSGNLSRSNVMWTQLFSAEVPSPDTWLRTIDGDHAWRVDGLPRFCDAGAGGDCVLTDPEVPPTPRPAKDNAGDGTYPLWESCQNRTAFRSLFVDWENGAQNFPDLGDPTSFDPSDAAAPEGAIRLSGNSFSAPSGTTYVGGTHAFTLSASDETFTDAHVTTRYRFYRSGTTPGAFAPIPNGGTFTIPPGSGDGLWTVELQSEDPCHVFEAEGLPDGSAATLEVFLDTTPPTIMITSPAPQNVVFDTDDFSSIQWTVTDAGSGVNASTVGAKLDGAAAAPGHVLDMFFLNPGLHQIVVSAADNLGNTGSLTRLFKVQATSASLVSNVGRACTLGLIAKQQCSPLLTTVEHAKREHAQGDHKVERNVLGAWINELEAQRGKKVDAATATRFIAYARDLIARAG
jgi:hypothetical protein